MTPEQARELWLRITYARKFARVGNERASEKFMDAIRKQLVELCPEWGSR